MNDADFRAQKDRLLRYFERWIPALHLNRWRIQFEFLREEKAQDGRQLAGNRVTLMECVPSWMYRSARVIIFLPTVARLAAHDDDLEWHVVHELLHLHLNELHDSDAPPSADFMDHEERVVSTLTTAILHGIRDTIVAEPETWRRVRPEVDRPTLVLDEEDVDGEVEAALVDADLSSLKSNRRRKT